jgi:hypothetical protein
MKKKNKNETQQQKKQNTKQKAWNYIIQASFTILVSEMKLIDCRMILHGNGSCDHQAIIKGRKHTTSDYCIRLFSSSSFTLPRHIFCASPRSELEFPTSYRVFSFMFNELRWEVVVCFVDIDGIVEHHSLNFRIVIKT